MLGRIACVIIDESRLVTDFKCWW